MGRGAGAGAGATAGLAGAATREAGAAAEGTSGAGAPLDATGAAGAAAPATAKLGAEPGARVGSLMVGADVGLGGKLMRTVSFLGCTLLDSAGLGGKAPPGDVGKFSAIIFLAQTK
jgi:hypothetical protein